MYVCNLGIPKMTNFVVNLKAIKFNFFFRYQKQKLGIKKRKERRNEYVVVKLRTLQITRSAAPPPLELGLCLFWGISSSSSSRSRSSRKFSRTVRTKALRRSFSKRSIPRRLEAWSRSLNSVIWSRLEFLSISTTVFSIFSLSSSSILQQKLLYLFLPSTKLGLTLTPSSIFFSFLI